LGLFVANAIQFGLNVCIRRSTVSGLIEAAFRLLACCNQLVKSINGYSQLRHLKQLANKKPDVDIDENKKTTESRGDKINKQRREKK